MRAQFSKSNWTWRFSVAWPSLRLSKKHTEGVIPPELGSLSLLNELYLAHNRIGGAVPPSLGSLVRLRVLSLSCNTLEGESQKKVKKSSFEFVFSDAPSPPTTTTATRLHSRAVIRHDSTNHYGGRP